MEIENIERASKHDATDEQKRSEIGATDGKDGVEIEISNHEAAIAICWLSRHNSAEYVGKVFGQRWVVCSPQMLSQ